MKDDDSLFIECAEELAEGRVTKEVRAARIKAAQELPNDLKNKENKASIRYYGQFYVNLQIDDLAKSLEAYGISQKRAFLEGECFAIIGKRVRL